MHRMGGTMQFNVLSNALKRPQQCVELPLGAQQQQFKTPESVSLISLSRSLRTVPDVSCHFSLVSDKSFVPLSSNHLMLPQFTTCFTVCWFFCLDLVCASELISVHCRRTWLGARIDVKKRCKKSKKEVEGG